jgi:hypothetical protein
VRRATELKQGTDIGPIALDEWMQPDVTGTSQPLSTARTVRDAARRLRLAVLEDASPGAGISGRHLRAA